MTEERRNGEETFKYEVVKSPMEHAEMPRMEWWEEWGKGKWGSWCKIWRVPLQQTLSPSSTPSALQISMRSFCHPPPPPTLQMSVRVLAAHPSKWTCEDFVTHPHLPPPIPSKWVQGIIAGHPFHLNQWAGTSSSTTMVAPPKHHPLPPHPLSKWVQQVFAAYSSRSSQLN